MWFIEWLKSLGPVDIVIVVVIVVILWKAISHAVQPIGYSDWHISEGVTIRMYDNKVAHLITTDRSGVISERELAEGEYEEQLQEQEVKHKSENRRVYGA